MGIRWDKIIVVGGEEVERRRESGGRREERRASSTETLERREGNDPCKARGKLEYTALPCHP